MTKHTRRKLRHYEIMRQLNTKQHKTQHNTKHPNTHNNPRSLPPPLFYEWAGVMRLAGHAPAHGRVR